MNEKIFNLDVSIEFGGNRIDKFLQTKLDIVSRTKIQKLIRSGFVRINNNIIRETSKKIKPEDIIEVKFYQTKKTNVKAYKMNLDILYEDNDIILINKPAGMVVHPGAGNYEQTLVNGLLFHYKNKLSAIGGTLRPGIVHRIDKDTSGVIVIAKNDEAHINLSKQFSDHTIERKYEALVWGALRPANGRIKEKISRSAIFTC